MKKLISIVIPVFYEEGNIAAIARAIQKTFSPINYNYEIIFVNDGSQDGSMQEIQKLAASNSNIYFIDLSRNFGKDNALLAGIRNAKGEALITIDADLQHPPELILEMIEQWEEGNEVVYAYRKEKNEHASVRNRLTSKLFYKLVNGLSDVELENGISDYRLLDKKVINILNNIHEDHPFFRGMIKWVGFKQKGIPYSVQPRLTGETKYDSKALVRLALRGITSFSVKPLSIAIYLGFLFSLLSLLYIPYVIFSLIYEHPISGWTSLIVTIVFFGGLQLMILGIIGMYLGKLFMQSKQRPHYIIKESNIV
jgi:dolichol-phosphate mannosyltransferase